MGKAKTPKIVRDISISDLAAELEVNEESVRRHIRRGAPSEKRNNRLQFNVAEYRAWMESEGLTGERGRPGEVDSPDLEAVRIRKELALARKYEKQNDELDRLLIPAAQVRQWVAEHCQTFKSRLIGLGAQLSPMLEGRDVAERQALIDSQIREILDALSQEVGRIGDHAGDQAAA